MAAHVPHDDPPKGGLFRAWLAIRSAKKFRKELEEAEKNGQFESFYRYFQE